MLFGNRPECEQLYFETFYNHHFGLKSWLALVDRTVLKTFDSHRLYHLTLFVKIRAKICFFWNHLILFINRTLWEEYILRPVIEMHISFAYTN